MRNYLDGMREMAKLEKQRRKAFLEELDLAAVQGRHPNPARSDECPLLIEPFAELNADTGAFFSFKSRRLVSFRSRFQADVLTLLEWDYGVGAYYLNGFGQSCGRKKPLLAGMDEVHVVSCPIARQQSKVFNPTVYLLQTQEELTQNWGQIKPALHLARRDAATVGRRYRLMTETRINEHLVQNARFLLRYRGPRFLVRTLHERAIVQRLEDAMMEMGDEFTPSTLLARAGTNVGKPEEMAMWMWNLYADHIIQCDMHQPFGMDTPSWRCGNLGCAGVSDRADWRQPANEWRR